MFPAGSTVVCLFTTALGVGRHDFRGTTAPAGTGQIEGQTIGTCMTRCRRHIPADCSTDRSPQRGGTENARATSFRQSHDDGLQATKN